MKFYEFHDTNLSNIVENAYHALAIDEHRQDYMATLWNQGTAPQQTRAALVCRRPLRRGGGYKDRRLSNIALGWMQQKASALGLALDSVQMGAKNYLGDWTDSYGKFLGGSI